jgi:microcystin-dependent protein
MGENYLSEIRTFAFGYAPTGWLLCDGRTLQVRDYGDLFGLLRNRYGGDGVNTFKLPNLTGAAMMHRGESNPQGQAGGETRHVLTMGEMPAHTHQAYASENAPDKNTPLNNFWPSNSGSKLYGDLLDVKMASPLSQVGTGKGHENMQPFLALNICIAVKGIYPQRP